MPRYIDADKLIEKYERVIKDPWNKSSAPSSWASAWECVIADIDDIPTADVVPKSEYDAVVSAVDNSAKEFLKLHDEYQSANAEIERLKHILDCYALQYGTVKEQQDVIDKANQEFAREIFEEIEEDIDIKISVTKEFLYKKGGRTAGKTIFQTRLNLLNEWDEFFSELKKKFTEANNEVTRKMQ